MSYRDELIQIAAAAVAAVQTLDNGSTEGEWRSILDTVSNERFLQEQKGGPQYHSPIVWVTILLGEVGEAAQEAVNNRLR
ncbi:MAG: hypothetical protein ACREBU_01545 [Nitrososphaera sp.]